jgi:carboxymethylenebutenolidase
MPAFLAYPAGPGRHPAVVLMHERYGLVQHTKDLASRCAEDGFVALAPNFFFKHPDQKKLNAGNDRYDLTDPDSIVLLKSALAALGNTGFANMSKIAVAGYCQTGRHPLVFAAEVKIQAAVVWYGAAAKREWEVNKLQPRALDGMIAQLDCPVFGAFGSDDHIISVEDVRALRNSLEKHKKSFEIHLYAGAPHGWLNDTMPGRYRKAQADAAWAAQQDFLKAVFAGDWSGPRVRWRFESEFARDYDFTKNVRQE